MGGFKNPNCLIVLVTSDLGIERHVLYSVQEALLKRSSFDIHCCFGTENVLLEQGLLVGVPILCKCLLVLLIGGHFQPNHHIFISFSDDNRSTLCFFTEKKRNGFDNDSLTVYRVPIR